MTTDRYNEEIFLGYLEGDLTPQQTVEFEKLMAEDPRLRNLVAQMVLDRHRLRKMPDELPPAEVMQTARESLERQMLLTPHKTNGGEPTPARQLMITRWITYASLAAMIALIAGLVVRTLTDQPILSMSKKQEGKTAKNEQAKANADRPNKPPVAMTPTRMEPQEDRGLDQTPHDALPAVTASPKPGSAPLDHADSNSNLHRQVESERSSESMKRMLGIAGGGGSAAGPPSAAAPPVAVTAPVAPPVTKGVAASKTIKRERAFISRYVTEDVPLPPPWDAVTDEYGAPQQLQITAASRESGEKEIRAWAAANHATVLTVAVDSELAIAQAGRANDSLGKQIAATDRQLVVLLPRQRVGNLVSHLNHQNAGSASLTVLAEERAEGLDSPKEAGKAKEQTDKDTVAANSEITAVIPSKSADQKVTDSSMRLRDKISGGSSSLSDEKDEVATLTGTLKKDASTPPATSPAEPMVALPIIINVAPPPPAQPAAP